MGPNSLELRGTTPLGPMVATLLSLDLNYQTKIPYLMILDIIKYILIWFIQKTLLNGILYNTIN